MKTLFQIAALTISLCMTVSAAAESSKVVDRRKDVSIEDQYVVFVSRPAKAGDTVGQALIGLATGTSAEKLTFATVVGLRTVDDKPVFGPASDADLAALRAREGTNTLIVRIDKDQAGKAREVLDRFAKRAVGEDNPAVIQLDLSRDAVTAVGLKQPYISGLSGPNVQQYYADLSTLNRK